MRLCNLRRTISVKESTIPTLLWHPSLPHSPGGAPATFWEAFRSRSAAVGRDLPRFWALFVPGPPPLGVRLLRFGGLFVAGPPRWGGTCHGLGPFSCLVHHSWECACYVLSVFRGRSAAVGRDLPRFGALFVPGPPPLHLPWGCACYVLGVFRGRSAAVGRAHHITCQTITFNMSMKFLFTNCQFLCA